jgi:zinc/manganese transport system permease protein
MNVEALFDRLFLVPFFNGLLLAVLLPVIGAYARLRGELLASLGVAQVAAAGIGLAAFLGLSVAVGPLVAILAAATVKALAGRQAGNDAYAVMILAGWSAALLLAANTTRGDELARALLEGQIYFTTSVHLWSLTAIVLGSAIVGPWLSARVLVGSLFPDYFVANGIRNPRHALLFDALLATSLAVAATVVGVMGAFALVVIPPWVAFRFAPGWRSTLWISGGLGVAAYVASFALAILFDQPYGPVLVVMLLVTGAGRLIGNAR